MEDWQKEFNPQLARSLLKINKEAEERWGGLKHSNLSIYIDKVAGVFLDEKLSAAVIIVPGIHPSRRENIQDTLKEKRFKIPTQVRVQFLDGGELVMQWGKKQSA